MNGNNRISILTVIGPGLLVAATGVGAGDLATAGFAGMRFGLTLLWAVAVGAAIKFAVTEGLARYQLATGKTLAEGCAHHLGWTFKVLFLFYLLTWSFFVGSALMSACGAAAHALAPLLDTPEHDKQFYGVVHSAVGAALVIIGGYALFEKIMRVCIGLMFVTVITTAILLAPDWTAILSGLFVPRIGGEGSDWALALIGGVGGTLTVLCYGYWIREEGRSGVTALRACRIDLAVGYIMTALFGFTMIIIGSQVTTEGSGAQLIVGLGRALGDVIGPAGMWLFLIGAWGAVFSSLLGVWQSVPYIFADFVGLVRKDTPEEHAQRIETTSNTYRAYLGAIAIVPILGLYIEFEHIQKAYAIFGAFFMPFLAGVLLFLNGKRLVAEAFVNRWPSRVALGGSLIFFLVLAGQQLWGLFQGGN